MVTVHRESICLRISIRNAYNYALQINIAGIWDESRATGNYRLETGKSRRPVRQIKLSLLALGRTII